MTRNQRKQASRLLSLPAELRHMIWEFAIGTDLILLYPSSVTTGLFVHVNEAKSVVVTRKHILNEHCAGLHGAEPSISSVSKKRPKRFQSSSSSSAKKEPPSKRAEPPFSWLCTNRQIYAEAKTLVDRYMNESLVIHICDILVFYSLIYRMLENVPKAIYNESKANSNNRHGLEIRSLSLCVKIEIESDLRDGFKLSSEVGGAGGGGGRRGGHGWTTCHGLCHCRLCSTASYLAGAADFFPKVQNLTLRVYFKCRDGQGNDRPVIGRYLNGNLKYGQLYRPRDPCALTLVEDAGQIGDYVANTLARCSPFRQFLGRKESAKSVEVVFCTEWISHNPRNESWEKKCWCQGRRIDADQLRSTGLGEAIEKLLLP